MSERFFRNLAMLAVAAILLLVAFPIFFDVVNVKGYEVGVVHKWVGGVQAEPLYDGTHLVWAGNVVKINCGTQKISFAPQVKNDKEDDDTADNEFDSIEVACGKDGGQKAGIILTVVYHLDKTKAVDLYRAGVAEDYQYTIMKRTIIDVVNSKARPREALEIYSGEGFNMLAREINEAVKQHPVMSERGIIIENATIYAVKLNPAYEVEIEGKQLAKQQKLRATEVKLAAVEQAEAAKAQAQTMVEQERAKATAAKITVTLAAEGQKSKRVLDAEAQKEEARLRGEGMRAEKMAQAEGEKALGLAQALVEDAKKKAMYDGDAGVRRAQVEIAGSYAEKLKGMLAGVSVIPEKSFLSITDGAARTPLVLNKDVDSTPVGSNAK